ncbi:MAG: hypothetical protein QXZ31_08340 [Thermofilaceae archaeon]
MNAALVLLFTAISFAIDAASALILSSVYRRMIAEGKSPVLPLSLDAKIRVSALAEGRGFIAAVSSIGLFWPFLEESVFRVAPYVAAGLPGALAGTAAWTMSHYVKLYAENSHLSSWDFAKLAAAYLGTIAAGGLTYAVGMHVSEALWLPYMLHVIHNVWVLMVMRREAVASPRGEFVKAPQASGQRGAPLQRSGKAVKSVGGIRWEYLE